MNGSDPLLDDLLRGLVAGDTLAVVTEGNVDHIHTLNTGHLYTLLSNNFIFVLLYKSVDNDMCDVVMSSVPDRTQ